MLISISRKIRFSMLGILFMAALFSVNSFADEPVNSPGYFSMGSNTIEFPFLNLNPDNRAWNDSNTGYPGKAYWEFVADPGHTYRMVIYLYTDNTNSNPSAYTHIVSTHDYNSSSWTTLGSMGNEFNQNSWDDIFISNNQFHYTAYSYTYTHPSDATWGMQYFKAEFKRGSYFASELYPMAFFAYDVTEGSYSESDYSQTLNNILTYLSNQISISSAQSVFLSNIYSSLSGSLSDPTIYSLIDQILDSNEDLNYVLQSIYDLLLSPSMFSEDAEGFIVAYSSSNSTYNLRASYPFKFNSLDHFFNVRYINLVPFNKPSGTSVTVYFVTDSSIGSSYATKLKDFEYNGSSLHLYKYNSTLNYGQKSLPASVKIYAFYVFDTNELEFYSNVDEILANLITISGNINNIELYLHDYFYPTPSQVAEASSAAADATNRASEYNQHDSIIESFAVVNIDSSNFRPGDYIDQGAQSEYYYALAMLTNVSNGSHIFKYMMISLIFGVIGFAFYGKR